LHPGKKGTRKLVKRYGDRLVCVRYRYDKARRKRLKIVELIVDEQDWVPGVIFPTTERVLLRVGYGETELREAVNAAGGFWDPEKKGWVLIVSAPPEERVKKAGSGVNSPFFTICPPAMFHELWRVDPYQVRAKATQGSRQMKTTSIPSLRVDPDLRQAAESVLQNGETLSSFVEKSLRASIEHRRIQRDFIA
jgi:hypothetical protein